MRRVEVGSIVLLAAFMLLVVAPAMAEQMLRGTVCPVKRALLKSGFSGKTSLEVAKSPFSQSKEKTLGKETNARRDSVARNTRSDMEDRIKLKHDFRLISAGEVRGDKIWERRKVPRVAFFCNVFLPGLGEVYNGRRIKAALMVGLISFYMAEAWINHKRSIIRKITRDRQEPGTQHWYFLDQWYEFHKESAKDYLWWAGAVWVIGMLDAYIDAHLFDLRAYSPEKERGKAKYLTVSWKF